MRSTTVVSILAATALASATPAHKKKANDWSQDLELKSIELLKSKDYATSSSIHFKFTNPNTKYKIDNNNCIIEAGAGKPDNWKWEKIEGSCQDNRVKVTYVPDEDFGAKGKKADYIKIEQTIDEKAKKGKKSRTMYVELTPEWKDDPKGTRGKSNDLKVKTNSTKAPKRAKKDKKKGAKKDEHKDDKKKDEHKDDKKKDEHKDDKKKDEHKDEKKKVEHKDDKKKSDDDDSSKDEDHEEKYHDKSEHEHEHEHEDYKHYDHESEDY